MKTAKLFKSGRCQAVRLPQGIQFPGTEVYVEKRGEEAVLRAKGRKKKADWEKFFSDSSPFPKDFLVKRKRW